MKKRSIRFAPDEGDFALVDLDPKGSGFNPVVPALIVNQSFNGCSLVIHGHNKLKPKNKCKIKIGRLAPLMAVVVWTKKLDNDICQLGFEILD